MLNELEPVPLVGILVLAYLVGTIPFANIIGHVAADVDLRRIGPGTVSPWNLYLAVGPWPATLAGAADLAKGVVGPALVGRGHLWLAALAGGLTVLGHNWSPLLRGAGGRGLSPATGALMVVAWPAAVVMCAGLVGGVATRHVLGAMSVAVLVATPVVVFVQGPTALGATVIVLAPIIAKTLVMLGLGTIRPSALWAAARQRPSTRRSGAPPNFDRRGVARNHGEPHEPTGESEPRRSQP